MKKTLIKTSLHLDFLEIAMTWEQIRATCIFDTNLTQTVLAKDALYAVSTTDRALSDKEMKSILN